MMGAQLILHMKTKNLDLFSTKKNHRELNGRLILNPIVLQEFIALLD
jgi:hypothetical protein